MVSHDENGKIWIWANFPSEEGNSNNILFPLFPVCLCLAARAVGVFTMGFARLKQIFKTSTYLPLFAKAEGALCGLNPAGKAVDDPFFEDYLRSKLKAVWASSAPPPLPMLRRSVEIHYPMEIGFISDASDVTDHYTTTSLLVLLYNTRITTFDVV